MEKKEKYITVSVFDAGINQLDKKIDRIAASLVNEIAKVHETMAGMATKSDVNRILDRMDGYLGKQKEMDQEQAVQGFHIKELRTAVVDHEHRITNLENS